HKVKKNIRELEGALTRVIAFASIHQREVDSEAAARLLSDIIPAASRRPISIDAIQRAVSDHYGIPLEELKGKRRDKHIVFPRQGGRRRLFLYTLRPGAELESNSTCTDCTGPTATPAEHLYRFSTEVVGTRSEG